MIAEQLELFDDCFDWTYVFEQIHGRSPRFYSDDHTVDSLGITEIDSWGKKQGLSKFSVRYSHLMTVRTMLPNGVYRRRVEYFDD